MIGLGPIPDQFVGARPIGTIQAPSHLAAGNHGVG
jgi:hypothetical protein